MPHLTDAIFQVLIDAICNPDKLRCMHTRSMVFKLSIFICLSAILLMCRDDHETGQSDPIEQVPKVTVDSTPLTYSLVPNHTPFPIWTTSNTHKVRTNERAPTAVGSGIDVYAAKREFEPFQLIVGPAEGSIHVEMKPFSTLPAGQRIDVATAGFEGNTAEHLHPVTKETPIDLSESYGVPIWITLFIPEDASSGSHKSTIHLQQDETTVDIPITLYVFDFALPKEIHFASQLNISIESLLGEGSVDDAKTVLFDHRMTPKSVTWPSGFNWQITWENSASDAPCDIFWDEPDEGDAYRIGALGPRYILGEGWNGIGFPNAMLFQFVDNSTPRPSRFCGVDRGDHFGTPSYNNAWARFLSSVETYLDDHDMLEKSYYYVQNEPQNDEDHRLAAHLCRLTKAAAPTLRIAISEEPKKEIAEDDDGSCGYDIWIAHVRAYQRDYAWQRQRDHGETVWFYSLDHDPDPYFNPTAVENDGIHQRIIPWVAWQERIRGWAYYDAGRFFDGPTPTIRAELLREGFEDYEYLFLAAGSAHPEVFLDSPVDETVGSVASSLTSWTKDPDALLTLKRELGYYLEGTRETLPVIESSEDNTRARDTYYINFQDPNGEPTADPLLINGNSYLKIGWNAYSDDLGYGWYGEYIENSDIAKYGFDDVDGYNDAAKSYLYDDYGRDNLFEFALESGAYEVTVGAGRPARGYQDPHNVTIEGIPAIEEQTTTDNAPTIESTVTIDLNDGRLSLEMGGLSPSFGDYAYTFLAYLIIRPISSSK